MKGTIAKEKVIDKIKQAFGSDYLGEVDKKYYVTADDGGEQVQIAISLTCCKNPIAFSPKDKDPQEAWDWDDTPTPAPAAAPQVSEDEQKVIAELMERLGL